MGTAFTVDTPIRIAKYGISSVMSIGDDELCETMRLHHAQKRQKPVIPINKSDPDYRVKRIRGYLNLVDEIIKEEFQALQNTPFEPGSELTKYFDLLAEDQPLKQAYHAMLAETDPARKKDLQVQLSTQIRPGRADVNIMTKIDRDNYDAEGNLLPDEYSDALTALRAFATSTLESAIIFSAGFNRRLYAYIEQFQDFFPDTEGKLKKEIILKVSDYRSSHTQGKFLAKKGIWVSEHRIESGLNCGGHAFATDGYLLGPILEEFKTQKAALTQELLEICNEALAKKGKPTFSEMPETRITVQGGIGTHQENQFLFRYYQVDGTGWATPFLLVPEVTTVDPTTREQLRNAGKEDLFLSEISPLGVPFNTMKNTASEQQRLARIESGKPGSACPKAHLVTNTEFSKKPVCTASTFYQKRKIEAIEKMDLEPQAKQKEIEKIVAKTCLCEDLAASALILNDISTKRSLTSAICPGPNLAYFSKISTLSEMMAHIYGKLNLLNTTYRPNMFMSELKMYIDYLTKEIKNAMPKPSDRQIKHLNAFKRNLLDGIEYYKTLIPKFVEETTKYRDQMKTDLLNLKTELDILIDQHKTIFTEIQEITQTLSQTTPLRQVSGQ